MIRAAFFGSSLIAGSDLRDPRSRFSTVASRILRWQEINLGCANSHVVGRDNEGRFVSAVSGVTRTPDVIRAEPDVVIVLFGEEDYKDSVLVGQRRIGPASDSVAGIPAVTRDRRSGYRRVDDSLRPLTAPPFPLNVPVPKSTPVEVGSVVGTRAAPGTFAGDYDTVVAELLTRLTPARIYLLTPPYRPDSALPNAVGSTSEDYAEAVRAIAVDREVRLLDAYRESTIQAASYSRMSDDGRTLNADGHQHLAAFLIESMAPRTR